MGRLLESDPVMRIRRNFHFDEIEESFHIETVQDVSQIVELNKASTAAVDERAGWKGDMHLVARIPMNLFMELQQKGIADDDEALRRWLNDSDNRVFRTRHGKV